MKKDKYFKQIKRICSVLTVICCLAGSILPIFAAEVPRAVFTNQRKETPSLYVTKTVENPAEAPADDPFAFILTINGETSERPYSLLIDGEPETDQDGNAVPHKTLSNGRFTLKHGQTAVFTEGISKGDSYLVSELPNDNYLLVKQEGTDDKIAPYGSFATFTNRYKLTKPDEETIDLEVRKEIVTRSPYQSIGEPVFTYLLEIKTASQQEFSTPTRKYSYSVKKNNSDEVSDTRETEDDGTFTLEGGYTAVFEELPGNTEYKVTEMEGYAGTGWELDKWWNVGSTEQTAFGSTTLLFKNSNLSFIVTKEVTKPEDAAEEDLPQNQEFKFQLADGEGKTMPGESYYLYNTDGEPIISPEDPGPVIRHTDSEGYFTLHADEAAVFIGINPNEVQAVHISETADSNYRQTYPENPNGDTQDLSIDGPKVFEFINELLPTNRALIRITKNVEASRGELPNPNAHKKFKFKIEKAGLVDPDESNPDGYAPLANKSYTILGGGNFPTDENGIFELEARQTAEFTGLTAEVNYRVTEIPDEGEKEYRIKDGEDLVQIQELERGKVLSYQFTNVYTPDKLDLNLTKVNGDGTVLKGAEFGLYNEPACETLAKRAEDHESGYFTTDDDGKLIISDLRAGTYYLQEKKAPSGYVCNAGAVKIEIAREGSALTIKINDKYICTNDETTAQPQPGKDDNIIGAASIEISREQNKNDVLSLTVKNTNLYNLPDTGGVGIYWYLIGGVLMMFASLLILYKNNFAGRCWKN